MFNNTFWAWKRLIFNFVRVILCYEYVACAKIQMNVKEKKNVFNTQ